MGYLINSCLVGIAPALIVEEKIVFVLLTEGPVIIFVTHVEMVADLIL